VNERRRILHSSTSEGEEGENEKFVSGVKVIGDSVSVRKGEMRT
jgi:hypothetical protein